MTFIQTWDQNKAKARAVKFIMFIRSKTLQRISLNLLSWKHKHKFLYDLIIDFLILMPVRNWIEVEDHLKMSYFGVFEPGRPTYKHAADNSRILLGKVTQGKFLRFYQCFFGFHNLGSVSKSCQILKICTDRTYVH